METPTMVRNHAAGPTVFTSQNQHVEWAGAGDPMEGDLQPVPEIFLNDVQFHRNLARGIFSVEQAPESIQEALAAHKAEYESRIARQQNASIAALDTTRTDDSLMVGCVGPSDRGTGTCGIEIPLKASDVGKRPPLCTQHAQLSGQYVAEEDTERRLVGGKPEIIWKPIQLGARTRQD